LGTNHTNDGVFPVAGIPGVEVSYFASYSLLVVKAGWIPLVSKDEACLMSSRTLIVSLAQRPSIR
jgi:hypothetical protein